MTPPHLEVARCKGPKKTKSKRSKKLEKSEKHPKKLKKVRKILKNIKNGGRPCMVETVWVGHGSVGYFKVANQNCVTADRWSHTSK